MRKFPINDVYYPMLNNSDRYNIFFGSAGSGKSVFSIGQKTVYECLTESNNRILILRKVARTLRDSVFRQIIDIIEEWGVSDEFSINKTDMTITGPDGNFILFKGCDDSAKLKSITKINKVKIEEADELSEQEFNQVDLRLRGQERMQLSLHFNPVDIDHWIYTRFFKGKVDETRMFNRYIEQGYGVSILRTTFRDNVFIGQEFIGVLEKLKEVDPLYYQVYALGEWGIIRPERPFADNFKKEKHAKRGLQYDPNYDLCLKFDFNIDNTCIAGQVVYDQRGNLKIRDLKQYHTPGWDLERVCAEIKSDFPNATYKINGDASGKAGSALTAGNQSAYDLIKNYLDLSWMQFNVPSVNPSHLNSRLLTNLILKTKYAENDYLYEIDEEGCPDVIKDFERVYVDKKGSLDECKRKHPELTHFIDPVRYHFHAEHYERINEVGYEKLMNQ